MSTEIDSSWENNRLADENQQLRAQLEVATAATQAAVSKAEWQSRTNGELNALLTENEKLRSRMIELLEILRNWEPDHASAEERRTIVQAMYQLGILTDPTETLRNMTEVGFVRSHG